MSKVSSFPKSPVSVAVLLHQLLENSDEIDAVLISIKTKGEGFDTFHTTAQLKDIVMMDRVSQVYVDNLVKRLKDLV